MDFCFPNLEEGKVLTNKEKPEEIVKELLNYYKNVVLKLGKKGCYLGNKKRIRIVKQNIKRAEADSTGAGDAFAAAFIADYLNNKDLKSAAERANEVAFKCVNKVGGRPPG